MNVTLSIDERLVEQARRVAAAMGKSLNQVIRDYLMTLTTQGEPDAFARELRQLSAAAIRYEGLEILNPSAAP